MKKEYLNPEINIIYLEDDVITASGIARGVDFGTLDEDGSDPFAFQ